MATLQAKASSTLKLQSSQWISMVSSAGTITATVQAIHPWWDCPASMLRLVQRAQARKPA